MCQLSYIKKLAPEAVLIKHFHYLLISILLLCLGGCLQSTPRQEQIDLSAAGYLSLFLNHSVHESQLHLTLDDIEIYSDPLWYPLTSRYNAVPESGTSQQLIAASALATGAYNRIRFQLTITDPAGTLLRQEQTELALHQPLEVKRQGSSCLFITSSLMTQNLDKPLQQQLSLWSQQRPLADELLYILCPQIQTLYVARVNPCRIVAAYGIGADIADMVIDNEHRLLYLLDRRNLLIQRFDAVNQTMIDRIPLPLTDQPGGLGISDDGGTLYVSDPANRMLLQIDAKTGLLLQQRATGYQPGRPYPFEHEQQDYVALLSSRDQQLVVMQTQTLTPLYSISAGLQPHDFFYADQHLFVSDMFSRQILKIAPETGQIQAHIATAAMPSTLSADPVNRNLLIALGQDHAIAFLPFGQQMLARRAPAGGAPADMALAIQRRLLFIALPDQQQISIIDLPSEKQLSSIDVASLPAVIVFQEP